MKKLITIIISIFISLSCFAKDWNVYSDASPEVMEYINKSEELIQQKQYQSAYSVFNRDSDVEIKDPEYIIYKRVEILTQYYAYNIMYQIFALKDLEKKETLDYIRTEYEGDLTMFMFNIEETIAEMQKTNKSPVLNLALAQFYAETLYRYGDQWLKTPQELIDLAIKNYQIAYDADVYDVYSLGNFSELLLKSKRYSEAEKYYEILTEKEKNTSKYWYNYTLTCMNLEKYEKAIELGLITIDCPEPNPAFALDEYLILSDAYYYSNDYDSAFDILKKAEKKYKKSGTPSIRLGELEFYANNNIEAANKYFLKGFKLEPTAYNENFIGNIYFKSNLYEYAAQFFKDALKLAKKDPYVQAVIYYDLSGIYYQMGDVDATIENLLESKKLFEKINDQEDAEYIQSMIRKVTNE